MLYLRSRSEEKARREFALLQRIDSRGVVRPVEVVRCGQPWALVVERYAGTSLRALLSGDSLRVGEFLPVAISAAAALWRE